MAAKRRFGEGVRGARAEGKGAAHDVSQVARCPGGSRRSGAISVEIMGLTPVRGGHCLAAASMDGSSQRNGQPKPSRANAAKRSCVPIGSYFLGCVPLNGKAPVPAMPFLNTLLGPAPPDPTVSLAGPALFPGLPSLA